MGKFSQEEGTEVGVLGEGIARTEAGGQVSGKNSEKLNLDTTRQEVNTRGTLEISTSFICSELLLNK